MVDWNPLHHAWSDPRNLLAGPVGGPVLGLAREGYGRLKEGIESATSDDKSAPKSKDAGAAAPAPPPDPTQQLVEALKQAFPALAGGGIQGSPGQLRSWQQNVLQPQLQKSVSAVEGANKQYEAAMQHLLGGSSSPTAKMMLSQMPGVEATNMGLIQGLNSALVAGPAAAAQQQSNQQTQTDTMKLYDMFQKLLAYVDPAMSQMTGLLGGGVGGGLTPQGLQGATQGK